MKFYMTLISATLGVGLVISAAFAQDKINYTEMVEDLKVMCRIIDETMDETFENDYVKGGFFRKGGCQHLYLKGYGALFLLDVQFSVSEKEMKIVKTEKKTNLWEKHEREVRHQGQLEEAAWVTDKNESYSKEKVDKLKEKLAYLVGEYGSRIGQLAFDDTISFVVFGYPDHAVDLETDFLVEMHVVEHVDADAMSHARETLEETEEKLQVLLEEAEQILEAKQKLEGTAEHVADAMSHARETLEDTEEKLQVAVEKMEEELKKEITGQEGEDDDKKVIIQRDETIIVEEEKDEEMEDSQPQKGKRLRMFIRPTPPTPPIPPTVPNLPHGFHGKPATTLILTFKRSQLEGKKGADWEALLVGAEVVEY